MTEMQEPAMSGEDHFANDEGNTELGEISPLLTSTSIIAALLDTVRGEIEKLSAREPAESDAA
jgi:hypothetical protein